MADLVNTLVEFWIGLLYVVALHCCATTINMKGVNVGLKEKGFTHCCSQPSLLAIVTGLGV